MPKRKPPTPDMTDDEVAERLFGKRVVSRIKRELEEEKPSKSSKPAKSEKKRPIKRKGS